MWNTFTAGLQLVQEKLDNVLDDSQAEQDLESPDGAIPSSASPPEGDSQVTVATQPPPPSQVTITTQPPSPARVEQPPPSPQESPSRLQEKVGILQEALDQAEQQRELINSEYRRLLGEKEKEILSLKELEQVQEGVVTTPLSIDHTSNIEILRKELAAHKEMVAELRDQLKEKEAEFLELNGKAESKFNRLKMQAKTKIASLNCEVERLKLENEGVTAVDDSVNTSSYLSISSADDSISTDTYSPRASTVIADHTPSEVESKLAVKEHELAMLKEEVCQEREKGEELRAEMAALKDKLNVSEVCLQKEQESRVSMELQVTRMEEHLDQVTSELSLAREERGRLEKQLEEAQSRNWALSEELNLVRSSTPDHRQAELQLAEGLPPVGSLSPSVMAAGERGSLLDMESEIASLESTVRERDEQLSSFKTVLEEKELLLEKQLEKEVELGDQLHILQQEAEAAQASYHSEIKQLQAELSTCRQDACNSEGAVKRLESSVADLESTGEALKQLLQEKDSHLSQLEGAIQEAETAREKLEAELSKKRDEVQFLSTSVESQKQAVEEKEAGIAKNVSHITTLEQSVQEFRLSNESLRSNIDSSKEETVEKIRKLETRVLELQEELQVSVREREAATTASRQLEDALATTQESLQQREEQMNESFSQQHDQMQQEIWDLKHSLEVHTGELQTAIAERDKARRELEVAENSLSDAARGLEGLKSEKEALTAQVAECRLQVTKSSGALEFAQEELAGKDRTIRSLSGALEEKKTALVSVEIETARLKSELVEKMTEVMQHSEQSVQSKEELREVRAKVDSTTEELKHVREELDTATREKESVKTELGVALARLEMQDREREASQVEGELLRGKVESLSKAQSSQSHEQQKQLESIANLTSQLAQKSGQVQSLQQKLEVAKTKLVKVVEERDREVKRRSEAEAKLGKHEKENEQMKQQFNSAVELMEAKVSEKSVAIARMNAESAQKASDISSLRDQLAGEVRKRSEMQERVMKLSADHKVSLDRCRHLESEKVELERTLGDLTSRHSHLEHSFSDAVSERESLHHQHHTSLASVQEYEAKMVNLTDQLGKLAREKHTLESQLHDLGKQVLSSEQSKLRATAELEQLKGLVQSAGSWESEKQVLLGEKAKLEQEKAQLQARESHLQSRVAGLESSLEKLEEDLGQSHVEMETLRGLSSPSQNNPEHQKQLSELQQSHAAELTHLRHAHSSELSSVQHALQEERKRREAAEKSLEAHGEVAISMEDVQPFAAMGAGETGPATLVSYMNMASAWVQRLIRNPNIVLTRLLRATHQTKLLLMGYFLVLHLLLLYLIIV